MLSALACEHSLEQVRTALHEVPGVKPVDLTRSLRQRRIWVGQRNRQADSGVLSPTSRSEGLPIGSSLRPLHQIGGVP
jgi:hypothetical protein